MNVSCTNCGKRYVLSDDKVAGKASVKIRCKQCQSLISIDVAQATASSPGGVMAAAASQPRASGAVQASAVQAGGGTATRSPWEDEATKAMPALDLSAQWHAMIGGVQQGPFDVKGLMGKVGAGEVTLRTYLWKAGMADWKRAAEVPEVSPLFAGASAPPTSSPSQSGRPPTRPSTPAVQQRKDVAVANEMPSPEVTKPRGGNVADPLPASNQLTGEAPAYTSRPSAVMDAQLISEGAPEAKPETKSEALDLFGDLPKSSGTSGIQETPSQPASTGSTGEVDPFAAMGEASDKELPPPGEATKFFIAQAGVNKRNPPWKIALFGLSLIGLPTAVLYLLSSFKVVELNVERTTEDGQVVQESFFSPGGVSGLKDMLTGDAKRKKAEAEQKERDRLAAIAAAKVRAAGAGTGTGAGTAAVDEPPRVKPPDPALAMDFALLDDPNKRAVALRDRDKLSGNAVASAGLKDDVAMKVVTDNIKAFNLCIEEALRRNPNLKVGTISVNLTVGQSGTVKSAAIAPAIHEGTDWGACMVKAGKRIVFPASDGESEVQVPLKLGVAM